MGFNPKKIIAAILFLFSILLVISVFNQKDSSSSICSLPLAFIFFIIGAFFWSGGKKDELRELEIKSKKQSSEKTESIDKERSEKVKEIILIRCPKCKAKNEEDAEYCKKCGKKL
jgi:ribosomal protein L40E